MKASQMRGFFLTFVAVILCNMENQKLTVRERLVRCVKTALPQGMKTAIWLLKLTIPVSFAVFLLDFFGVLNVIAGWVAPLFKLIGLSGQASIVLITSVFTNIYSVIAVMTTLGIGLREGTILAVMCLISHSFIVETAIQKKTGSTPWRIIVTRLSASFLAACMLNYILPAEAITESGNVVRSSGEFSPALNYWLSSMLVTTIKIIVLVNLFADPSENTQRIWLDQMDSHAICALVKSDGTACQYRFPLDRGQHAWAWLWRRYHDRRNRRRKTEPRRCRFVEPQHCGFALTTGRSAFVCGDWLPFGHIDLAAHFAFHRFCLDQAIRDLGEKKVISFA